MQPISENTVSTPAFLVKLWKMVNDPSTNNLIFWSPAGNSFIIQNKAQFWYELLPVYYKHNNMSSFVRQLNMYGFHKLSSVDAGIVESEKDEIQFLHPYFQKDQPDLLKNIKRKSTSVRQSVAIEQVPKNEEISRVLADVKQLKGRQANVDNQLNDMKQENALLWREVTMLRQRHLKQQKIVNKLIQFLVTFVQPPRMSVGTKRGYHLMLDENPSKHMKTTDKPGPTIHEVDNEFDDLTAPVFEEEEIPIVSSPQTSTSSEKLQQTHSTNVNEEMDDSSVEYQLEEQSAANTSELELSDLVEYNNSNLLQNTDKNDKVFLNPNTQDTLLPNMAEVMLFKGKKLKPLEMNTVSRSPTTMTLAKCDNKSLDTIKSSSETSAYTEDLSSHIKSTENELEQVKEYLSSCTSFDANDLLGVSNELDIQMFNESLEYDINTSDIDDNQDITENAGQLVSGSDLAPYSTNFDFTELFDDTVNDSSVNLPITSNDSSSTTINTPQISKIEPTFPSTIVKKK